MNTQNKTPKIRTGIIAILIMTIGLGCLCMPGGVAPPNTTEEDSPAPPPPTPTPIPPPTEAEDSTESEDSTHETGELNAEGPWLLMETDQGLWAANPDGSGLTQLTEVDYWQENLQEAVQPMGNQVVFISPGSYDFHNMALNLVSLPDGKVTKITDLTSSETEAYADLGPGDPGFEALRAIGEQSSYAWSPDGTRLAFAGLMDGPTAEIYMYDAASGEVKRVSTDETQNFAPSWSPDGETLLYFGADSFGTGAGYDSTGVWSVRGDGTNVTWLYVPEGGVEDLVGWLDNTTAVMSTWTPVCGSEDLRLFDVVSTAKVVLNEGCFISAAANSLRGEVLFANDSGLYLLTADEDEPLQVSEDPVLRIDPWTLDNYVFTVRFEDEVGGIATFGSSSLDYQESPISAPARYLDVAAYGAIWGWTSMDEDQPGAWISGPGVEIGEIFPSEARLPIWDPDNNLLFFAREDGGGYSIYRTTFDTFYDDLNMVGFVDAYVQAVAWLGVQWPFATQTTDMLGYADFRSMMRE